MELLLASSMQVEAAVGEGLPQTPPLPRVVETVDRGPTPQILLTFRMLLQVGAVELHLVPRPQTVQIKMFCMQAEPEAVVVFTGPVRTEEMEETEVGLAVAVGEEARRTPDSTLGLAETEPMDLS